MGFHHTLRSLLFVASLAAINLLPVTSANADDGLNAKTLEHVKAATVFIKVRGAGFAASGTGFLMGKVGDKGYIITNSHVVGHKGKPADLVHVVFGSGTKDQLNLQALIMGNDPDRDLAVLVVQSDKLPAVIKSTPNIPRLQEFQKGHLGRLIHRSLPLLPAFLLLVP